MASEHGIRLRSLLNLTKILFVSHCCFKETTEILSLVCDFSIDPHIQGVWLWPEAEAGFIWAGISLRLRFSASLSCNISIQLHWGNCLLCFSGSTLWFQRWTSPTFKGQQAHMPYNAYCAWNYVYVYYSEGMVIQK